MLLGGFLVFQGNAELSWMLLAACGGSVIGDSVGYYLGHRHGNRLRRTWLGRKVGHDRWEAVDRFLHERSGRTIFFAKFLDRKSTRLNSSHANISYAVFCLKK